MLKVRPLGVPKHCQQELSSRGMWHETFERRRSCVLPLHALQFGFWSILMNSSFISLLIMQIKKLSPSWLYGYKRLDQMYLWLHLCCSVRWLGTHLVKTCGTQEWHAIQNRLYHGWYLVVMQFLLLLFYLWEYLLWFLLLINGWCWWLSQTLGINYICPTIF